MHIKVDLPIDKPLRRGGHVVSKDGEKSWIHFRYERLPTFCFLCGMLGHDDKHCQVPTDQQGTPKQYGEWLRANGSFKGGKVSFKGGNVRQKTFSSTRMVEVFKIQNFPTSPLRGRKVACQTLI